MLSQIIAINNNDNINLFSCGLMNKEQYVVHISIPRYKNKHSDYHVLN